MCPALRSYRWQFFIVFLSVFFITCFVGNYFMKDGTLVEDSTKLTDTEAVDKAAGDDTLVEDSTKLTDTEAVEKAAGDDV